MSGWDAYCDGNYQEAATHIRADIEKGNMTNVITLADIYWRDLDNADHPPEEGAYYYILAADNDDCDALSFLNPLNPCLIDKTIPIESRIHEFLSCVGHE